MSMNHFTFEVDEGIKIFVRKFMPQPNNEIKGIVLISHGISEHSGRYTRFAEALNQTGFVVYAHDQRGHGKTSNDPGIIYVDEGGVEGTIDDINRLYDIAISEYKGVPVFLFGHSLGSFFARKYIQKYQRQGLKGVILCGPVSPSDSMQLLITHLKSMVTEYGRRYIDMETLGMIFGSFNERFQPPKTPFDWITSDEVELNKYLQDPLCGQPQSIGYLYDYAKSFDIFNKEAVDQINKDLAILFITGDQDPVSNYGEGAEIAKALYQAVGIKDLKLIKYSGVRHELLNEVNWDQVTEDVIGWLVAHLH